MPTLALAVSLGLSLTSLAVVVGAGVGARRGAWDFLTGLRAAEWSVWGAALGMTEADIVAVLRAAL